MPLSVNHLSGFGIGSLFGDPISLAYSHTVTSSTNGTTFTFSSQALGTPSPTREIFIVVNKLFTSTVGTLQTTSTINGVAITVSRSRSVSTGRTSIARAVVPTGTTGDIVINTSQTADAVSVSVYIAYSEYIGFYSSEVGDSTNPISSTIELTPGGMLLGGSLSFSTTDGITWSEMTQDVDGSWVTENKNYSSASRVSDGVYTVDPEVSNTGGSTTQNFVAASYFTLPVAGDVPITQATEIENDNNPKTTYTFLATNLSNPEPASHLNEGRIVFVCAVGESSSSGIGFGSCTVDGNPATLINQTNTTSTIAMCMSTFYISQESGATADIVVNASGSAPDVCAIIVFTIYGSSGAPHSSSFTAVNNLTSISPTLSAPSVPCSAICIVASGNGSVTSFSTMTEQTALNGAFASGIQGSVATLARTTSGISETINFSAGSDAVAGIIAWTR